MVGVFGSWPIVAPEIGSCLEGFHLFGGFSGPPVGQKLDDDRRRVFVGQKLKICPPASCFVARVFEFLCFPQLFFLGGSLIGLMIFAKWRQFPVAYFGGNRQF